MIDKRSFEEAELILQELIAENPSYDDAIKNLNRLIFQKNMAVAAAKPSSEPILSKTTDLFIDPLAAAFSEEEVAIAGGVNSKQEKEKPLKGLQPSDLPERTLGQELQEHLL